MFVHAQMIVGFHPPQMQIAHAAQLHGKMMSTTLTKVLTTVLCEISRADLLRMHFGICGFTL